MKNNLFYYATSELSQDAFICWLLSFALKDCNKEPQLTACAKNLIKSFIPELKNEDTIYVSVVPERQYNATIGKKKGKIDALITVNDNYKIIIEDKTFSSEHDNQLLRYKTKVKNDFPNSNVIGIYYKTGLLTPQENRAIKDAGYDSFDIAKIHNFFKKYDNTDNVILSQYIEHISHLYALTEVDNMPTADKDRDNIIRWNNYFIKKIAATIKDYEYDVKLNFQQQCASIFIWKTGDNLIYDKTSKKKYRKFPVLEICSKDSTVNFLCRDSKTLGNCKELGEMVVKKYNNFKISDGEKKLCTSKKYFSNDEELREKLNNELFDIYDYVLQNWRP